MMMYISVEALCKPQGTEGRAKPTPPRKKSLSGVVFRQAAEGRLGLFAFACPAHVSFYTIN